MATRTKSKATPTPKAAGTSAAPKGAVASTSPVVRLYRVWRHTAGDESAHEIAVIASSEADAKAKALDHVKKSNPGKGGRSQAHSQSLTNILSARTVVDKHCLEISSVPLEAIRAILGDAVDSAIKSVDEKKAERAAAKAEKAAAKAGEGVTKAEKKKSNQTTKKTISKE